MSITVIKDCSLTEWNTADDPEKNENNRQIAERWIQKIKEQVKKAEQEKQVKEKAKKITRGGWHGVRPAGGEALLGWEIFPIQVYRHCYGLAFAS